MAGQLRCGRQPALPQARPSLALWCFEPCGSRAGFTTTNGQEHGCWANSCKCATMCIVVASAPGAIDQVSLAVLGPCCVRKPLQCMSAVSATQAFSTSLCPHGSHNHLPAAHLNDDGHEALRLLAESRKQAPKAKRQALPHSGTATDAAHVRTVRMAEEELIALLLEPNGEQAVRHLFSRPAKLVVPMLEALVELPGGPKAFASLLHFMSPVQACRFVHRPTWIAWRSAVCHLGTMLLIQPVHVPVCLAC